jgi:hypothetical protein
MSSLAFLCSIGSLLFGTMLMLHSQVIQNLIKKTLEGCITPFAVSDKGRRMEMELSPMIQALDQVSHVVVGSFNELSLHLTIG